MSGQGSFNPVVLIPSPNYPLASQKIWAGFVMDQGDAFSLSGNLDASFGVIYLNISSEQIDAPIAQNRLNVEASVVPKIPVSLNGSGDAIRQFPVCVQALSADGAGGSGAS